MEAKNEGSLTQATRLDAASVFGASVQLPMFDRTEPDAWFILADVNFNLRGVTDSRTKYWYVMSKFDAATLKKLSTFLQVPRGNDPYQELREMLCETYEPPVEQKIDAFLGLSDIGDERPSEFGLEIQRLTAKASMDDVRKRMFLRCLPKETVTAITASLGASLQMVVKAADKAWTAASASPAAHSAASTVTAVTEGTVPTARGSKRGGRQRGARPSGQMTTLTLCNFHKRFGNAAKRCMQGCSRWGEERPRGAPSARVFHVEDALDGEDEGVGAAWKTSKSVAKRGRGSNKNPPSQLESRDGQNFEAQMLVCKDTGSQVSLWPPSASTPRLDRASVRLTAANGTPIRSFGQEKGK